jgi:hypothetical protein
MNQRPSRHHLLFPRAEWDLRPEGRKIRQTRSMIPTMRRDDHDYLHSVVPIVPALGHHTLNALPGLWTPQNNTYTDLDSLCVAIDRASAPHRVHQLERDLAGLAIEALLLERNVLKETGIL